MLSENTDLFPVSRATSVKGSRRLAREKALQVLIAYQVSKTPMHVLISHIFYRKFNFGDNEEVIKNKILTEEEVYELEADVPVIWNRDEIEFGKELIRLTLQNKELADELIIKFAVNWELERIALIDHTLMTMTVTELLKFDEIPTKVSINEAIDISKKYSTPKSGIFINGVLDAVLEDLSQKGLINKSGRGLQEK